MRKVIAYILIAAFIAGGIWLMFQNGLVATLIGLGVSVFFVGFIYLIAKLLKP